MADAPSKMAAGLRPGRALLSRRRGALCALLCAARGLAARPETHFGFQNVTEAERREKSEGGSAGAGQQSGGGSGPGGAGGGSVCGVVPTRFIPAHFIPTHFIPAEP